MKSSRFYSYLSDMDKLNKHYGLESLKQCMSWK